MTKLLSALVLASAVTLAVSPAVTAADAPIVTLTPRQGISLDVGSKRAVGYFLSDSRICNLTLLVADRMGDNETIPAATRLQFEVAAGSDVRVDTSEGKALAFSCATNVKSMRVEMLEQLAAYSPRR